MLLTIEWKLKTPIYFPREELQPVDGLWVAGDGILGERMRSLIVSIDNGASVQLWCSRAGGVIMLTLCTPLTTHHSPPRPGHDGCHPLGGSQWIVQKTALKRNISWSNPGVVDVGIKFDCVIIWVTVPDCSLSSICTSIVHRFVHRWLCSKLCKTLKEVHRHFSYKLW